MSLDDTAVAAVIEAEAPPPLAYVLTHEAWYTAPPEGPPRRGLTVTWRAGHRTIWEQTLVEHHDGLLDVAGYTNSWDSLAHGCALLAELLSAGPGLAAVRAALDARGAVDETVRVGPYATLAG